MTAADSTSDTQFAMQQHYKDRTAMVAEPNTHWTTSTGDTHEFGDQGESRGLYNSAEHQDRDTGSDEGLSEVDYIARMHRNDPGGNPESEWATKPSQGMMLDPREVGKADFRARYQSTHDVGLRTSINTSDLTLPHEQMVKNQKTFDTRVRSDIANSSVPINDLRAWATKTDDAYVHGDPKLVERRGVLGSAYQTGMVVLDTEQAGPSTLIHEIGHEVHIPEKSERIPGPHPHPVLEGVADAYMDRYSHPSLKDDTAYTTALQTGEEGGWNHQDLATYLTTRKSAAQQGVPVHASDRPTRQALGRPMVDPEHPAVQDVANKRGITADSLNKTLEIHDRWHDERVKPHHVGYQHRLDIE